MSRHMPDGTAPFELRAAAHYLLAFDALPFRSAEGPRGVVCCPLHCRRPIGFSAALTSSGFGKATVGNSGSASTCHHNTATTIAATIASYRSRLGPKSSDKEHAWSRLWEAANRQTVRRGRERKDLVYCGHAGANGTSRGGLACSAVGIGIGRPKLSIAMRTHLRTDGLLIAPRGL